MINFSSSSVYADLLNGSAISISFSRKGVDSETFLESYASVTKVLEEGQRKPLSNFTKTEILSLLTEDDVNLMESQITTKIGELKIGQASLRRIDLDLLN
jgi:hypothetical protein